MPGIAVALQIELAARHDLMNVTDNGSAEFHDDTIQASVFNEDPLHLDDTSPLTFDPWATGEPHYQTFRLENPV